MRASEMKLAGLDIGLGMGSGSERGVRDNLLALELLKLWECKMSSMKAV